MATVTGRIDNWYPNFANTITGNIYNDTNGRFPDGMLITTSPVQGALSDALKPGQVITTNNSTYLLGEKA